MDFPMKYGQTYRVGRDMVAEELQRRGVTTRYMTNRDVTTDYLTSRGPINALVVTTMDGRPLLDVWVKTKRSGPRRWVMSCPETCWLNNGDTHPVRPRFWVLVAFGEPMYAPPRFWVVPDARMEQIALDLYNNSPEVRAGGETYKFRVRVCEAKVEGWEDRWDVIRAALPRTA